MGYRIARLAAALPLTVLLCAACTAERSADGSPLPQPAGALQGALPEPAALPRSASAAPLGRGCLSKDYISGQHIVSNAFGTRTLQPQFNADSPALEDLAFAIYEFDLTGYAEDVSVEPFWGQGPPELSNIYVAIADFARMRWRWFSPAEDGIVHSGGSSEFIAEGTTHSAGRAFVAVVLTGEGEHELLGLRIGDDTAPVISIQPPFAIVESTARGGFRCEAFDFEAALLGEELSYAWEYSGEDLALPPSATFGRSFTVIGQHLLSITVTDSAGQSSFASVPVEVFSSEDFPLPAPTGFGASDGEFSDRIRLSFEKPSGELVPDYYQIDQYGISPPPRTVAGLGAEDEAIHDDMVTSDFELNYSLSWSKTGYFHLGKLYDTGFTAQP